MVQWCNGRIYLFSWCREWFQSVYSLSIITYIFCAMKWPHILCHEMTPDRQGYKSSVLCLSYFIFLFSAPEAWPATCDVQYTIFEYLCILISDYFYHHIPGIFLNKQNIPGVMLKILQQYTSNMTTCVISPSFVDFTSFMKYRYQSRTTLGIMVSLHTL
jgi:hypothetical protein